MPDKPTLCRDGDKLVLDGVDIADLFEEDRVIVFDEDKVTNELETEALELLGDEWSIEVAEPAPKPTPKKRAKKRVATVIDGDPDVKEATNNTLNVPPSGFKDPSYVRALHERSWKQFCKTYEVNPGTEQRAIDCVVKTEKEDLRYPARWTTVLTRKARP